MKFCPGCGARRLSADLICPECGADLRRLAASTLATSQNAAGFAGRSWLPRPRFRFSIVSALAGLAIMVVASQAFAGCSSSGTTSLPSLAGATAPMGSPAPSASTVRATPSDAVTQYLHGVADRDVDEVLDACAIDEAAAHFDFAAQAERLQAIIPSTFLLPASYSFYAGINRYGQGNQIFFELRGLAYSLLTTQPVDQDVAPVSAGQVEELVKDLDPARLAGLTVPAVKFPISRLEKDSRTLANFAAQARVFGADELTERLALIQLDGRYYAVGFRLVRYGADWKVLNQVSSLAGTPATGAAQPTTMSDFLAS